MSSHIRLLFLSVALTGALHCGAQDKEELSKKYPGDHAVLWDHSEHLTFRYEDGHLQGRSEITREIFLLTDQAANQYNTDNVYHGYQHQLLSLKAETLLPDGVRVKRIKATEFKTTHSEEENIFYTDSKQTQVTYSNLARYARTKLEYSLLHDDVHFLVPFYFRSYMPVRSAVYTVTVPKSVQIGYTLSGLHTDKIKFTTEEGRNEVTYSWSVSDMPRATYFEDGPASAYTMAQVLVYVKSYKAPRADTVTPVLASVGDLYRYYYAFVRDVNLKADDEMANIVTTVCKDATTPREKAARIYKWVQEHIRYVAYEDSLGGYIPRGAAVICNRRFGDCKDMTSLLVAMCRQAGLDAHFTWIGTRDIPYRYKDVPTPIATNHMICAVKMNDEWLLMDGTDRVIPFGKMPAHLQDKEALVSIDAGQYKVITIPTAPPDNNTVTDTTSLRIAGDSLVGEVRAHYTGYGAWRIAGIMQYSNEQDKEKILRYMTSRGSDKYKQQSTNFLPAGNTAKDCALTANFSLGDYARRIGNETYVNLNLQRSYDDDYVDMDLREVPIQYSYKHHLRQIVSLKIPAGYKATYIPPDKADGEPGLWSYKIHYEQRGDTVWLIKDFVLDALQITPEHFTAQNRLVESLRNEYKESVVLTSK
jgi:hypothetical protein